MFRSLKEDITESQTDIRIQKSDLFEIPLSLNTLQIDNKLIIYNKMEKKLTSFIEGLQKGAFMTKASDHSSKLLYINYLIMSIRYFPGFSFTRYIGRPDCRFDE